MKALMLYRPNTEGARVAEDYVSDFERLQGHKIDLVNLDTKEGAIAAQLYDMPAQPTLMVLRDDGQIAAYWSGTTFPLTNEVAAYLAA